MLWLDPDERTRILVNVHVQEGGKFSAGYYDLEITQIINGSIVSDDFELITECIEADLKNEDLPALGFRELLLFKSKEWQHRNYTFSIESKLRMHDIS